VFIGHFALGFAAKRVAPQTSLGTLFLAAQFVDLLWPTLLLLGVERVAIDRRARRRRAPREREQDGEHGRGSPSRARQPIAVRSHPALAWTSPGRQRRQIAPGSRARRAARSVAAIKKSCYRHPWDAGLIRGNSRSLRA